MILFNEDYQNLMIENDFNSFYSRDYSSMNENEIPNFYSFNFDISNGDNIAEKKREDDKSIQIGGKSTNSKTIMNKNNSFNDIFTLLNGKCSIMDKIIKDNADMLLEIEKNIQFMKKLEMNELNKNIKNNVNNAINKGRKPSQDPTIRKHNKFSEDNIIKKIKGFLIRYLEKFANNLISEKNKKLKHIDFNKYIKNVKKENELELMQKKLKDILSSEISSKNTKSGLKYNEQTIQLMMNDKNNKNKELFNFVFNLKFIDWIHLFTLEKKASDFCCLNENDCSEIENKIPKIQDLYNEILKKNENDEKYLLKFVYLLYNYENYFINKVGRTRKINE